MSGASLVAQMVRSPPAMHETWVQSLGWEDPLEEGMATHSSNLAWRIPMERGAWQATVRGVAKSQTWLSDWTELVTQWTVACQVLLSMGFARQEYWSGLPFPSAGCFSNPGIEPTFPALTGLFFTTEPPGKPSIPVCAVLCLEAQSFPTLCDSMDCSLLGSSVHRDSPGKNTGVGCHALLQRIFPTHGSNPSLHIAGGFFTIWATRKALYQSWYLLLLSSAFSR